MTMMTTTFKSPSGRMVVTVEGRAPISLIDWEWVEWGLRNQGVINKRLATPQEGDRDGTTDKPIPTGH